MKKLLLTMPLLASFATTALAAEAPKPEKMIKSLSTQVKKSIKDMDKDGDKAVSVEEYTQFINNKALSFDKDGTKGLSKEEYKTFALAQLEESIQANPVMATQLEQIKSAIEANLDVAMQQFDTNKDGTLNTEELTPVNASGFAMTDFNQDGKLDMGDVESIKKQMGL
ncbi:MAG: hypothetical protein ACK5MJ_02500 [Alphaproteobacteria bacterium]